MLGDSDFSGFAFLPSLLASWSPIEVLNCRSKTPTLAPRAPDQEALGKHLPKGHTYVFTDKVGVTHDTTFEGGSELVQAASCREEYGAHKLDAGKILLDLECPKDIINMHLFVSA